MAFRVQTIKYCVIKHLITSQRWVRPFIILRHSQWFPLSGAAKCVVEPPFHLEVQSENPVVCLQTPMNDIGLKQADAFRPAPEGNSQDPSLLLANSSFQSFPDWPSQPAGNIFQTRETCQHVINSILGRAAGSVSSAVLWQQRQQMKIQSGSRGFIGKQTLMMFCETTAVIWACRGFKDGWASLRLIVQRKQTSTELIQPRWTWSNGVRKAWLASSFHRGKN